MEEQMEHENGEYYLSEDGELVGYVDDEYLIEDFYTFSDGNFSPPPEVTEFAKKKFREQD